MPQSEEQRVFERVCDVTWLLVKKRVWCVVLVPAVLVGIYLVRAAFPPSPLIAVAAPPGQLVERVQEVECDSPSGWPVVVVRDVGAGAEWWVQQPARAVRGTRFVATSHFGNEKTPPGTRYQLVVLAMRDAETASHFTVGSRFDQLPSETPHSEPIELIRQ